MSLTDEQKAQIEYLHGEGLGTRAIAKRLDLTRGVVRWYLERNRDPQIAERLTGPLPIPEHKPRPVEHPKGWEPGVAWDSDGTGHVTVQSDGPKPDFRSVIEMLGYDPDLYAIEDDRVHTRTYEMNLGRDPNTGEPEIHRTYYYRANIIPRVKDDFDIEALKERALAYDAKPPVVEESDADLVINLADWQAGKRDGDSIEGLIGRVHELEDAIVRRHEELKAMGRRIENVYLAGLGDLLEGCDGFYATQTFGVRLHRREQTNIVRRLLYRLIELLARLFPRVIVIGVPGNHGENRKDGKAFTSPGDNDDLAVFDQLYDVCSVNPAFDHVTFVIPREEMSVTLDIRGTVVNFSHGHQMARGGNPYAKAEEWIKGQAFGKKAAGDADVYVTGHYHHFAAFEQGARTWLQCPALEDRSNWFENYAGPTTKSGTLTFTITEDGWGDLAILN